MQLTQRFRSAWNVFRNKDPTDYRDYGPSSGYRPDRMRLTRGTERSIATSVYNRIAVDVAMTNIRHVELDENGRYLQDQDSGLNFCLSEEANLDQTGRELIHDAVLSMMDEGCVAIVPTVTDDQPKSDMLPFEVLELRTGKILNWYPKHIMVEVYNSETGQRQQIKVPKRTTAIIENPFYSVMNAPNSTMQRLIRKLSLLDIVDEKASSGKLDLIIQLPYVVKGETRRAMAEKRRSELETQLTQGTYGVAYMDGTERITQLNRPVENNLMRQIEYLTNMFYSQLGIDTSILDGTANPDVQQSYFTRIVEPILLMLSEEMRRKFLSLDARKNRQDIRFFNDPLRFVPVGQLAEMSDKLTRNEILTSNEFRQILGMKPSSDPNADKLLNKNLSAAAELRVDTEKENTPKDDGDDGKENRQNG